MSNESMFPVSVTSEVVGSDLEHSASTESRGSLQIGITANIGETLLVDDAGLLPITTDIVSTLPSSAAKVAKQLKMEKEKKFTSSRHPLPKSDRHVAKQLKTTTNRAIISSCSVLVFIPRSSCSLRKQLNLSLF
ncbi:hypothetical protein V6N12_068889 [Hibiscus sabdariffa]|uniref:Uncharacterized protein n=1 Tax=Hibiscus sabdariffa TaxID=183260 RepID=A0ABR2CA27_9ROSI